MKLTLLSVISFAYFPLSAYCWDKLIGSYNLNDIANIVVQSNVDDGPKRNPMWFEVKPIGGSKNFKWNLIKTSKKGGQGKDMFQSPILGGFMQLIEFSKQAKDKTAIDIACQELIGAIEGIWPGKYALQHE